MRSQIIACCVLLFAQLARAEEAETGDAAWKWDVMSLNADDFAKLVVNEESEDKMTMRTENGWFIKFYAPWCGHCQRLAPVWEEFNKNHGEKVNIAKVDCTDGEAQPLCSKMEVRGYPTLIYFPGTAESEEGAKIKAYKYQGMRTPEALEEFALNGGWRNVGQESVIPFGLGQVESWMRWVASQRSMIMRDIDMAWTQYGLFDYIGSPFHYWIVAKMCMLPFVLVIGLLCCIGDDEPLPPQTKP